MARLPCAICKASLLVRKTQALRAVLSNFCAVLAVGNATVWVRVSKPLPRQRKIRQRIS